MTSPATLTATAPARPARAPGSVLALVVLGTGCLLPFAGASPLLLSLLVQAIIGAMLATGVGFLVRQNGMVSFGHALFFGLGGYVLGVPMAHGLLPPEMAVLLALLVPALLAFLLGLVITRIPGVAFSMLSLACAQTFYEVVLKVRTLANGDDGMSVTFPARLFGLDVGLLQDPRSMYLICWVLLAAVLVGLWLFTRSPYGLLTLAIRSNEERARFIGYETVVPRAAVYALSAGVAGLAGVLATFYNGFISPDMMHWTLSGSALVMAVIGGTRAVWGPALGAVVFFFFKEIVGDATEHWPAVIGITLIVVTLCAPAGLSGLLARLFARRAA
ncbi:branched-chain amino acid ABC transporter permease [Xanthobacter sp. YC-JY1]|uniref:branched-chain amino acid ABC transporter permease n=1 Tax=Xanthobacter sp. YC-JY1 TaxID=2419844 RepID=UPI001F2DC3A1|nr:branched-chain amino acid ABC transporter permease [Xanthobacter sp. YC-JY1]UJX45640.1 branched-chain amino acid ABC transporter permease [Xanthobacter sp. YC-JY1]